MNFRTSEKPFWFNSAGRITEPFFHVAKPMKKENFVIAKAHLLEILYFRLKNIPVSTTEHREILTVVEIVNEYTYINRLRNKGRLTRIIIDSLNLDYQLGDLIIQFDKRIS